MADATITKPSDTSSDELIDELRSWLEDNWDPDLTLAEWWDRLGLSGWAAPSLPTTAFGRGLQRADSVRVVQEISKFGAVAAPAGLGLLLAAPTIADQGNQEQIDRYVREIVTGQKAWCQLFSEPGAGSDLAGLTTKAVQDGEEWIVNGQKVWTSGGQIADLGMLIARTDPDVPKHQGITYFAIDMHQPGIEVRPLREMTGRALFNEVFMTDARVADSARIGERGHGWAVANTTLGHERAGLGSGGGGAGEGAVPGTIAKNLDKRVGDFVGQSRKSRKNGRAAAAEKPANDKPKVQTPSVPTSSGARFLIDLAKGNGTINDPTVRQDLMRLHTLGELGRYNGLRTKAARAAGRDIPGMPNISKLSMSDIMRLTRDLSLRIIGPYGTLHAYNDDDRTALGKATGNPFLPAVTEAALFAQAPPIYGGTDQVQHNIIGERVLGLPKEPNNDKTAPFSSLPKNT